MLGTGIFKIDAEMAEMMPFKDEVCNPHFKMNRKGVIHTGCPVKLSTLRFCYFLGFQITYKRTSDHFSIAQKIRISKLTLLYFLRETFIKLQDKMRDKLDFDSIILMADFVPS